jgi:hypothetical protein
LDAEMVVLDRLRFNVLAACQAHAETDAQQEEKFFHVFDIFVKH